VILNDVVRARKRIAPYVRRTTLSGSRWLSDLAGAQVSLKLESLQPSNSFKSRGAFNAVIARLERGQASDLKLVTASAGNHGRALASAAEVFQLPLVVFTPAGAPDTKLAAIRRHGAELRAEGRDYDDAEILAKQFAQDTGATFISPYNDPDVIAGAATMALEIFEDAPLTDTLIVPIGGAGLISGVAAAAKALAPASVVFGVEAEVSCAFQTSVCAGRLVDIVPGHTLADGLGGNPDPQTITFDFVRQYVDRIVTVSERDLAAAIVGLIEHEHLVAEGAGGAATAAIVGRRVNVVGRRVAVILSGSNIDRARLTALLGENAGHS
jgi:threonine dehydratase